MVKRRRHRKRAAPWSDPFTDAVQANDVWCIDFKGWFRTRNGRRVDPLTVQDASSRFLLACAGLTRPKYSQVRRTLDRTFREYGLPRAIRTDNGPPFASLGLGGLTQLSIWWIKLGIIPGWGGTQRLAQLIGPSRAKQMIFSGERVAAEQGETWGLVNEVVPPEKLAERALELASTIAANGPVAVQLTKQLIDAAFPASGDSGVVLETLAGSLASYTADAQEGVAAFRQRRPPQFSGR